MKTLDNKNNNNIYIYKRRKTGKPFNVLKKKKKKLSTRNMS